MFGLFADLTDLSMADNNFTGTIHEDYFALGLVALRLDANLLTNSIPESFYFSSLVSFGGSANMLTGPISSQIRQMTSLEVLKLFDNLLTGMVPSEIGNMSSLGKSLNSCEECHSSTISFITCVFFYL